jgi:RHS repeat-associated protein
MRSPTNTPPTDRRYTGQRQGATLGVTGDGLYDYGARFYDPYLNHWIQPDTIVPQPGDPQSLNRCAYGWGNPVKFTDPSGHLPIEGEGASDVDAEMAYLWSLYQKSDWQKYWGKRTFMYFRKAYTAYNYYAANPEAFAQDSNQGGVVGDEADSVMWARQYAENVKHHTMGLTFSDYVATLDEARQQGNGFNFWGAAAAMSFESEYTPFAGSSAGSTGPRIHWGQQDKHIPGTNNHIEGRSILTHPDPQGLVDQYAGTGVGLRGTPGQPGYKEKVDFGQIIGLDVDMSTKVQTPTSWGIIHYSKQGVHIVPTLP